MRRTVVHLTAKSLVIGRTMSLKETRERNCIFVNSSIISNILFTSFSCLIDTNYSMFLRSLLSRFVCTPLQQGALRWGRNTVIWRSLSWRCFSFWQQRFSRQCSRPDCWSQKCHESLLVCFLFSFEVVHHGDVCAQKVCVNLTTLKMLLLTS